MENSRIDPSHKESSPEEWIAGLAGTIISVAAILWTIIGTAPAMRRVVVIVLVVLGACVLGWGVGARRRGRGSYLVYAAGSFPLFLALLTIFCLRGQPLSAPVPPEHAGAEPPETTTTLRSQLATLGISVQDLTADEATSLGLPDSDIRGAEVKAVTSGSLAAVAGIKVADVIRKCNNNPVQISRDIAECIGKATDGRIELTYYRYTLPYTTTISLTRSRS